MRPPAGPWARPPRSARADAARPAGSRGRGALPRRAAAVLRARRRRVSGADPRGGSARERPVPAAAVGPGLATAAVARGGLDGLGPATPAAVARPGGAGTSCRRRERGHGRGHAPLTGDSPAVRAVRHRPGDHPPRRHPGPPAAGRKHARPQVGGVRLPPAPPADGGPRSALGPSPPPASSGVLPASPDSWRGASFSVPAPAEAPTLWKEPSEESSALLDAKCWRVWWRERPPRPRCCCCCWCCRCMSWRWVGDRRWRGTPEEDEGDEPGRGP